MAAQMFRVASISLASRRENIAQNVVDVAKRLAQASRDKISLAVFPEHCLVGYGSMAALRRNELDALAEPLDGPSIKAVAKAVERAGVAAGVGFIERASDGRLFNSYVVCMPGGLHHCHRKLHASEHRRISSGDRLTVFDAPNGVRIGILIGEDNCLVENARMMALMGTMLLVAPQRNRLARDTTQPGSMEGCDAGGSSAQRSVCDEGMAPRRNWLQSRAADNGMFVVSSEGVEACDDPGRFGTGMLIDPYGSVLAQCVDARDDLVAADLDLRLIRRSPGHRWLAARRPELYGSLSQSADHVPRVESGAVRSKGSIAVSFAQVARGRLPG